MVSFIKSFCKYRRFTADASRRQEFEDYLHLEMYNHKESKSNSAVATLCAQCSLDVATLHAPCSQSPWPHCMPSPKCPHSFCAEFVWLQWVPFLSRHHGLSSY